MPSTTGSASLSIPLYLGRGRERRSVAQLRYLQSEMNYTWLVWDTGERLLLARSLGYMLARLPDSDFVRLNRQYVVHRRWVVGLERQSTNGGVVYLTTGERLPVSRRRWVAVRAQLSGLIPQGQARRHPAGI